MADDVFPRVPVRQWVLSFPYEIRYRLAYDGQLIGAILAVFLRAVGAEGDFSHLCPCRTIPDIPSNQFGNNT